MNKKEIITNYLRVSLYQKFNPKDMFYSEKWISNKFQCSRQTARACLNNLIKTKDLISVQGSGYVVTDYGIKQRADILDLKECFVQLLEEEIPEDILKILKESKYSFLKTTKVIFYEIKDKNETETLAYTFLLIDKVLPITNELIASGIVKYLCNHTLFAHEINQTVTIIKGNETKLNDLMGKLGYELPVKYIPIIETHLFNEKNIELSRAITILKPNLFKISSK